MQELGGAECFGMEIGRFFQFQRSFSRNGQRRAAPNRNHAVRPLEALHQRAPIQFGGGGEAIWQSLQRASQRLILGPQRRETRESRKRCNESFCGGHTEFWPSRQWQDELALSRQLARGIVRDACRHRAGVVGCGRFVTFARFTCQ